MMETRVRSDNAVRRRRTCASCGHRWSTLERIYAKLPHPQKGKPVPRLDPYRKRKLTSEQVLAIYHADLAQTTLLELANRHGVTRETVRQIRAGETHRKLLANSDGLHLCSNCIHWARSSYCTMGFPDPEEEGPTFAAECSLYEARNADGAGLP